MISCWHALLAYAMLCWRITRQWSVLGYEQRMFANHSAAIRGGCGTRHVIEDVAVAGIGAGARFAEAPSYSHTPLLEAS